MDGMLGNCLENVRKEKPLIHCITNYVSANDVANMLLACGGSPVMADDPLEVEEITALANGLDINLGTLQSRTAQSMLLAGKKANELGHAVLLDPVGAGASKFRTGTAFELLNQVRFDAVRGNISEIRALAEKNGSPSGVDAAFCDRVTRENLSDAVAMVKQFANRMHTIVAVTGEYDLIADAATCYVIENGRPEMRQITGSGCMLSGLMTAYLSANPDDSLRACAAAACAIGVAGELAWNYLTEYAGNASYRNALIDAICRMDADTLERSARYTTM